MLHLPDWYLASTCVHKQSARFLHSLGQFPLSTKSQPAFGACFVCMCVCLYRRAPKYTRHSNVRRMCACELPRCRVVRHRAATRCCANETKWPFENWQRCFQPVLRVPRAVQWPSCTERVKHKKRERATERESKRAHVCHRDCQRAHCRLSCLS